MKLNDEKYQSYINILKEELIPAMGCTEPIAIAYLASYATDVLGSIPKEVSIELSGNILKNVKSVIVPNTDKMKGIKVATAAGIVCGDASKQLEVISHVSLSQKQEIKDYLANHEVKVKLLDSPNIFDMLITLHNNKDTVQVRISNYHTNIVYVKKNDQVILNNLANKVKEDICDKSCLSVKEIVEFASIVNIEDIKSILDRQIEYNMKIAKEGLKNDYGANIGKTILECYDGNDVKIKVKAYGAAASDARMSGCELPVIIVSGSGNQGITASVPVIVYAQEKGYSQELLYRALCVSNLVTIHQKSGIGRLSAFCGAVSAGVGSGAGIAYLDTQDTKTICHTIVNALAIVSGMVCDGAKASCAAKIQAAIDAGMVGYCMYLHKQQFKDGDGLIVKGVENTINNISCLARDGMKETDKEIINMMIKDC